MHCHLLTVLVYLLYNATSRCLVVPSVIHSDAISSIRSRCQLNRMCLCRKLHHIGWMTDHLIDFTSFNLLLYGTSFRPISVSGFRNSSSETFLCLSVFLSLLRTSILPCSLPFCLLTQQSALFLRLSTSYLSFFLPTGGIYLT